jgi:hypothetical protein
VDELEVVTVIDPVFTFKETYAAAVAPIPMTARRTAMTTNLSDGRLDFDGEFGENL